VTILLVTHFMEEAERLCDRIALIDSGRVAVVDTPAGLTGQDRVEQRIQFRPGVPFDDTTYDTGTYVLPAIAAGATGYLLKDAPREELLRAVRAAAGGEAVLSPSVAARLMNRVRTPAPEVLSQRELDVLRLVAAGRTNREAGAELFISEATVKTHLLNIYAKLGVSDRAAAVATAYDRGLLVPRKPGS